MKKTKIIISAIILSLMLIIEILLISIICCNEEKRYKKILHDSYITYQTLLTENLRPVSNNDGVILNEIFEYRNIVYKYFSVRKHNKYNISKFIIDKSLRSNEIKLPKCLNPYFENPDINDSIFISDYEFKYKGIHYDEFEISESNYVYVSNDFFVDLYKDVELEFVIGINHVPYQFFKFLISDELEKNEVIIPNSLEVNDKNFVLALRHINIDLEVEKKNVSNESEVIYVSKELYNDLLLYYAGGGYAIDTNPITLEDIKKLKENNIYIDSSYVNSYIRFSQFKSSYSWIVISSFSIILVIMALILAKLIKNKSNNQNNNC